MLENRTLCKYKIISPKSYTGRHLDDPQFGIFFSLPAVPQASWGTLVGSTPLWGGRGTTICPKSLGRRFGTSFKSLIGTLPILQPLSDIIC